MKPRFLTKLSIAILVPVVLGTTYAIGTGGDSEQAAIAQAEAATAAASTAAAVQTVAAAHRIARAKCGRLGVVERGNCRTEARAQAKRDLKVAQENAPRV